ncbi:MAG: NAD(P)/FAD-dependent oxidoreductase [Alphaproteobacteria bacterium]|nr:NAD(P)/FAD-dependent oxidoreductase [Rickettsiales bacterium]
MIKKYDTVIIGSGLGAMVTAGMLAKKGRSVLIMEQHYIPGGCATSFGRKSEKTGKSYKFDVALHELDGLDHHDIKVKTLKELGVFDNVSFVDVPEFYHFDNGRVEISIPSNTEEAKKVLIEKFPEEKRGINRFFNTITKIRRDVYYFTLFNHWSYRARWRRLMYILYMLTPLQLVLLPWITFNMFSTIGRKVKSMTKNKDLQTILVANIAYYHDDPMACDTTFFSAAQGGYFQGTHNINGGGQKLSNYLWKVIGKNGGDRMLNTLATRILVSKRGKVEGVAFKKCSNGVALDEEEEVVYCSNVVSGADPHQTASMLPEKYDNKIKRSIRGTKESMSLTSVYFAMKTKLKESLGSKHYSNFVYDPAYSGVENMRIKAKDSGHRSDSFVFIDNSNIEFEDEKHQYLCTSASISKIEDWENLSTEEYRKEKERFANFIIDEIEKRLPGFRNEIDIYEVATPLTIRRYTKAKKGATYGFAQINSQSSVMKTLFQAGNNRSSIVKNLYFSSAWSRPGGGFTGTILSGIETGKIMLGR